MSELNVGNLFRVVGISTLYEVHRLFSVDGVDAVTGFTLSFKRNAITARIDEVEKVQEPEAGE